MTGHEREREGGGRNGRKGVRKNSEQWLKLSKVYPPTPRFLNDE